jgi:hypothetical protein
MLRGLLGIGLDNIKKEGEAREKSKLGLYRGGSSGCLTADGKYIGTCPRLAMLRYLGAQEDHDFGTHMIFESGIGHENYVIKLLLGNPKVAKIEVFELDSYILEPDPRITLLPESLVIEKNGITVSGRPDFIVTMDDGYKFAIETKAVVSEKKAIKCTYSPFMSAICQSTLYRDMTGLDYFILYGVYSSFGKFYFKWEVEKGKVPSASMYSSLERRNFPSGTYIKPASDMYEYKVMLDEGNRVHIKSHTGEIIETPVTTEGVWNYYFSLDNHVKCGTIPDKITDMEINGKPDWSSCKYCIFADECKLYDKGSISGDDYKAACVRKVTPKIKL